MNKEEYQIYSLLYELESDPNFRKQELVQIALKFDTVTFVRIYNLIQQHDEATRKEIINRGF